MTPFPKEFSEVVLCVAQVLDGINDARADDGKISLAESAVLAAKLAPEVFSAVRGLGGIPDELRALDRAQLDLLYERFLTELGWEPSDTARDRMAVAFEAASGLVLAAIKWRNTTHPPKAEIVQ